MVFGALRLYYIFAIDFADVTASQLPVVITGTLQAGVAIMVSSSPLLKPVFDATFRRIFLYLGLADRSKHDSVIDPGRVGNIRTVGGGIVDRSPEEFPCAREGNGSAKVYNYECRNESEVDGSHEDKYGIPLSSPSESFSSQHEADDCKTLETTDLRINSDSK